jgi:hypothetical protein
MANAPTPPIAERSAFWPLGHRFDRIRSQFYDTYTDIKDVYLLGKYLAWPFYFISEAFEQARDLAWQADDLLVWINTWVKGIVDGNVIKDIIDMLSSNYRDIRNNPLEWVYYKIRDLSYELIRIVQDARQWFSNKLLQSYPIFNALIFAPIVWVKARVEEAFPAVVAFLASPAWSVWLWVNEQFPFMIALLSYPGSQVIVWINGQYPHFLPFLQNPIGYVKNWVYDAFPDMYGFLNDPLWWLRQQLSYYMRVPVSQLDNIPLGLLRYMFFILASNQGFILTELEKLVCDLIVRFI